jgi:hypothetical protein
MVITNPRDWRALEHGDPLQHKAFGVLERHRVFETLAEFDPAHVSTIGNGLATDSSDIDVVCSFRSREHFEAVVQQAFCECPGFRLYRVQGRGEEAVIAAFEDALEVEIYASFTKTEQHLAYRHYVIACRLLMVGGEELARTITERKRLGVKTEPAFAQVLRLEGDPYLALLDLEHLSDHQLGKLVRSVGFGGELITPQRR